jgi:hypothetical protein
MRDLLPLRPLAEEGLVGEGKERQQHAWIISFVAEVLTRLSGLGWNIEEARAGAHMVEKWSIQSIKDHKTME